MRPTAAPVWRRSCGGSRAAFCRKSRDSLEQLDGLLLRVARSRQVHRDGVRLHGLRYIDPALAAYVGEARDGALRPRRHDGDPDLSR